MRHGILLFSLLVLLAGTAGGIFVLVHQDGWREEVAPEVLVANVALEAKEQVPPPAPVPSRVPPPTSKININIAGYEELQGITGVGPAIAQRIIDYRTQNGSFQTIEEIKSVKGIGDVTFEKMKDEITV